MVWNDSGDGILIDPSVSTERERKVLVDFIHENGIVVKRVVNTHLHLDHVLGNAFVERTFGVKAEAHEEDNFLLDLQEEQSSMFGLPCDDIAGPLGNFLAEGDAVEVPGIKLQVLHIPGHSPGCIALYEEKEKVLFSGDILFCGGIGRTDLFGGDAEALLSGLKNKLFKLPPDTIVFPGHGPHTTIGDESQNNAW